MLRQIINLLFKKFLNETFYEIEFFMYFLLCLNYTKNTIFNTKLLTFCDKLLDLIKELLHISDTAKCNKCFENNSKLQKIKERWCFRAI